MIILRFTVAVTDLDLVPSLESNPVLGSSLSRDVDPEGTSCSRTRTAARTQHALEMHIPRPDFHEHSSVLLWIDAERLGDYHETARVSCGRVVVPLTDLFASVGKQPARVPLCVRNYGVKGTLTISGVSFMGDTHTLHILSSAWIPKPVLTTATNQCLQRREQTDRRIKQLVEATEAVREQYRPYNNLATRARFPRFFTSAAILPGYAFTFLRPRTGAPEYLSHALRIALANARVPEEQFVRDGVTPLACFLVVQALSLYPSVTPYITDLIQHRSEREKTVIDEWSVVRWRGCGDCEDRALEVAILAQELQLSRDANPLLAAAARVVDAYQLLMVLSLVRNPAKRSDTSGEDPTNTDMSHLFTVFMPRTQFEAVRDGVLPVPEPRLPMMFADPTAYTALLPCARYAFYADAIRAAGLAPDCIRHMPRINRAVERVPGAALPYQIMQIPDLVPPNDTFYRCMVAAMAVQPIGGSCSEVLFVSSDDKVYGVSHKDFCAYNFRVAQCGAYTADDAALFREALDVEQPILPLRTGAAPVTPLLQQIAQTLQAADDVPADLPVARFIVAGQTAAPVPSIAGISGYRVVSRRVDLTDEVCVFLVEAFPGDLQLGLTIRELPNDEEGEGEGEGGAYVPWQTRHAVGDAPVGGKLRVESPDELVVWETPRGMNIARVSIENGLASVLFGRRGYDLYEGDDAMECKRTPDKLRVRGVVVVEYTSR